MKTLMVRTCQAVGRSKSFQQLLAKHGEIVGEVNDAVEHTTVVQTRLSADKLQAKIWDKREFSMNWVNVREVTP